MTGTELVPANPAAIERELAEIETEVGRPGWWGNKPLQERHRALLDARDARGPMPRKRSRDEVELASLEALMHHRGSAYWHGPDAERNQQRYRELVAARDGGAPVAELDSLRRELPPEIVKEWSESPLGFDGNRELAKAAISTISACIRDAVTRFDFEQSAKALPPGVQVSLLRELTSGAPARSQPASDDALVLFTALGMASPAALWPEDWRRRAGVALDKFERCVNAMGPSDRATFSNWWIGAGGAIRTAVIQRLADG